MLIGVILPPDHPWRQQAQDIGTVTYDGGPDGLIAAIRTPQNLMLIDASQLQSADLRYIHQYRTMRDKTRIIVSYPNDIRPGNTIMAEMVKMHVVDMVDEETPLSEAMARNPGYADVSQWVSPETATDGKKWPWAKKQVTKEQMVPRPARQPEPLYFSSSDWGRLKLEGLEIVYTVEEARKLGFTPYGRGRKASQIKFCRDIRPIEEYFAEWWNGLTQVEQVEWREEYGKDLLRDLEANGAIIRMPNSDYIRCST